MPDNKSVQRITLLREVAKNPCFFRFPHGNRFWTFFLRGCFDCTWICSFKMMIAHHFSPVWTFLKLILRPKQNVTSYQASGVFVGWLAGHTAAMDPYDPPTTRIVGCRRVWLWVNIHPRKWEMNIPTKTNSRGYRVLTHNHNLYLVVCTHSHYQSWFIMMQASYNPTYMDRYQTDQSICVGRRYYTA